MASLIARLYLTCGLLSAVFGTQNDATQSKFPFGDLRNCPLSNGVYHFPVLPGGGWDNLRNLNMGFPSLMNYSKCKTSDDGKYLIPDNVFLYPVKESKVHTFSELYDNWNKYSSTTSHSINVEASVNIKMISISGSFSHEFESVKKHQVEDYAVTTRVQMRLVLYTAVLQPDSALQPVFKSRLLEIASHLQQNNTAFAKYLAQILVRDFGTHFVTSVKAGAVLAKVDHLKKKFFEDFNKHTSKIKAAASVSFAQYFSISFSTGHSSDTETFKNYINNTVYSTVSTYGGPPFRENFTVNQWEDQLLDELVAIDRSGDPLNYAITPASLPELSEGLTFELANVVEQAIKQYYEHNTIKGCTKMDSPNFSFQANLNDGSCENPPDNYTFGGVFQTCQSKEAIKGDSCRFCGPLLQKNPLTADYSCSDGYEAVLVHQGRTPQGCHRHCYSCWIFFKCCHNTCHTTISTYWCVAKGKVPPNTGYLFGGLYSNALKNPVTQDHSCPVKFYPLRFGATMHVCVSDDYELGYQSSVPFGGFFSCKAGNPLGVKKPAFKGLAGSAADLEQIVIQSDPSGWSKSCPTGYSQHLGAIEDDCEINFCVKSNVFNSRGLPIIKRPPFSGPPIINNYTVPLLVINNDTGQIWFKRSSSPQWVLATKSSVMEFAAETNVQGAAIIGMNAAEGDLSPSSHDKQKSSQSASGKMDAGTAAGITLGLTAFVGLAIAVIVIGWRRHKSVHKESSDLKVPLNSLKGYGAVIEEGKTRV